MYGKLVIYDDKTSQARIPHATWRIEVGISEKRAKMPEGFIRRNIHLKKIVKCLLIFTKKQ